MKINSKLMSLTSKYRIAVAGFALAIPALLFAVPAKRGILTVNQPDGTTLQIKKLGDERFKRSITADNLPLIYDEESGYVYATTDANGQPVSSGILAHDIELRSAAEKSFISKLNISAVNDAFVLNNTRTQGVTPNRLPAMGSGLCTTTFPTKGSPRTLIILVEFKDKAFSIDKPYEYYNRMLNEDGFNDHGATGSVKQWFESNSKGQFTPQFDIYGPVKVSHNMRYYGQNDKYTQFDLYPHQMVVEACELINDQVNFKDYDVDGDGMIDNVYVFYAGYGEADSSLPNTIWPHSFDLSEADPKNKHYFDGVLLEHYATSNELDYNDKNIIQAAGMGTFVHEFSHVIGLPDLYDTSSYPMSYTPGSFNVLDYGPYNNNGHTPPNYSAYERFALGWMQPKLITQSGEYSINPIQEDNEAFLIPTKNDNEYFLLENRQLIDNDKYLPGHGMLAWHILYDQYKWDNNTVNNDPYEMGVDLVEADNIEDDDNQDGDPFPGTSNVTKFGFNTRPALKSHSGANLYIDLSNITENNNVISFYATVDATGISVPEGTKFNAYSTDGKIYVSDDHCAVFNASGMLVGYAKAEAPLNVEPGLYIVSTSNGSVKLLVK